jgi:hypothetical protein
MPEGRIQALTHRSEHTVWQQRWISHANGARGLIDVVIVEADLQEAIGRFRRFFSREARVNAFGPAFHLDRGRVQLVDTAAASKLLPELRIPGLPFIAAYGIATSLLRTTGYLRAGHIPFDWSGDRVIARFPDALGVGCWVFVENAAALPWRM